jgi:YD repeat-containing protein
VGPLGATLRGTYDANGLLTLITYPANAPPQATTAFAYDLVDRLTTVDRGAGVVERFAYDALDREVAYTDPNGNVTRSTYAMAAGARGFDLLRTVTLIYNTSQVYEIVGDLVKAEAKLREAIALDPYYAEYHNDLGNLLSKVLARESEALEAYAQAIALSPPYYEAHLNRGILRAQIGDLAGAQSDFERVLEIKPQEWRALREIGNIRLMAGDAAGALESYLCALRHEERDADLQTNAGLACSELDDGEGAVQHYHSAIAVNPLHADAHNNLAAELVKYGRYDEALKHAQLAAKHGQNPDFARNLTAIEALCARSLDS